MLSLLDSREQEEKFGEHHISQEIPLTDSHGMTIRMLTEAIMSFGDRLSQEASVIARR